MKRATTSQTVEKHPSAAFPSSFAIRRTEQYASWLRISGALHLGIIEQPGKRFLKHIASSGGQCLPALFPNRTRIPSEKNE
jgi:hypothetical protein